MNQPESTREVAKFRTRLKELREQRELSRMDLVRDAKMSYPTVVSWENNSMNHVSADIVHRLTNLLGCTVDELVYVVEDAS